MLAGVGDRAGVFAASDAASGCFVYQSRQLAEAWLLAGCMQSTTVDAFMHHPSRVSAAAQRCDRVSSADGVTLGTVNSCAQSNSPTDWQLRLAAAATTV